jgi:hypothetical protein
MALPAMFVRQWWYYQYLWKGEVWLTWNEEQDFADALGIKFEQGGLRGGRIVGVVSGVGRVRAGFLRCGAWGGVVLGGG